MNPVDRFQALIRHPDCRKFARSPHIQLLKLGLDAFLLSRTFESHRCSLDEAVGAINFLRVWSINYFVNPGDTLHVKAEQDALHAGNALIFKHDLRARVASEEDAQRNPDHGHLLTIRVDLKTPTPELKVLIAAIIDKERKLRGVSKRKRKEHKLNPWRVWDMMQEPGNNLLKITHTLYGEQEHPAYHPETNKIYSQVKRAYMKAESLIKEVGGSRSKPLTENEATVESVAGTALAASRLLARLVPHDSDPNIPLEFSPRQIARMTTQWKAWLKRQSEKA